MKIQISEGWKTGSVFEFVRFLDPFLILILFCCVGESVLLLKNCEDIHKKLKKWGKKTLLRLKKKIEKKGWFGDWSKSGENAEQSNKKGKKKRKISSAEKKISQKPKCFFAFHSKCDSHQFSSKLVILCQDFSFPTIFPLVVKQSQRRRRERQEGKKMESGGKEMRKEERKKRE